MNKYKVTEGLMNELNKWNKNIKDEDLHMDEIPLDEFPILVDDWIFTKNSVLETINRLITLMHFVNGEDVFEVVTPSYVVRLKDDIKLYGKGYIVIATNGYVSVTYYMEDATRFDDFNKASEWANKHFEVVEVDE